LLGDREGFARQQRFIHQQGGGIHHGAVRGNAVAFIQDEQIALDDFMAGDAHGLAVAHDKCAGARQIAQGFQRTLGLSRLKYRDREHDKERGEQHHRVELVAQRKIDCRTCGKEQKHGFAQDIDRDAAQAAPLRIRQAIGSIGLKASARVLAVEAGHATPIKSRGSGRRRSCRNASHRLNVVRLDCGRLTAVKAAAIYGRGAAVAVLSDAPATAPCSA
jgi:hypothetical protein